jgi:hypothetical protein
LIPSCRRKYEQGIVLKNWGDPTTIGFNDCMVCLVQGVSTVPLARGEKATPWRNNKIYNYNSLDSFSYEEILFEDVKQFGFSVMHKYIRCSIINSSINIILVNIIIISTTNIIIITTNNIIIAIIRCTENVCHLAEAKYAKNNFFEMYVNNKTRPDAMTLARAKFQKDFRDRLGIKYYVPDPRNGAQRLKG